MKTISGIKAAWMEVDGLGQFNLKGRAVTFTANEGVSFSWHLPTPKEAEQQLRLFRAATKYPQTREAA